MHRAAARSPASPATSSIFKGDYRDRDPLRWSPILVEIALADWFPRKLNLDDDEIDALAGILRRWIRFAGERSGLSDEAVLETLEAVDTFDPDSLAAMREPNRAGPARVS